MGRPSVQAQRREEILDAFEICVAQFGVEGATLERIAEQAGLARPLIRHHLGNREKLVDALADRFFEKWSIRVSKLIDGLPDDRRSEVLLDRLFSSEDLDWQSVLVAEALISCSSSRPQLAKQMSEWLQDYIATISNQLKLAFPSAAAESIRIVSTGVIGIYFNLDSLEPLGAVKNLRKNSKSAAELLVNSLRG